MVDNVDRASDCTIQLGVIVILRPYVSDGKRWREPAKLAVLYVRGRAFLHFHSVIDALHVCRWGIGLFMYQTLDAIDGSVGLFGIGDGRADVDVLDRKQARRTGMAGPLGEMFDHGMCCPFPDAPL
jgi:hypothetical protein